MEAVEKIKQGEVYMIVQEDMKQGCASQNAHCKTPVTSDTYCVDLSGLVSEGYLSNLPVSPEGSVEWDSGTKNGTGYTLQKHKGGVLTVRACESEGGDEIQVTR